MATYAIGDLQGCLDELKQLLDQIGFGNGDRLWLTGDLINRGPQSLESLRFVKGLGHRAKVVLGNHDLHLLAVAFGAKKAGRKDTLDKILKAKDRDELLDWLRHLPLLHHDPRLNYVMVHAGIPPIWDLHQAKDRAAEIETLLHSPLAVEFFNNMYGNQPARWKPHLEGWGRYRLITNYFTRMRFCDARGKLELETKTDAAKPPKGYAPWFQYPEHRCSDQRILFGHWASLEGHANSANVYALDTGCVWGGKLTALRLEDGNYFSVASRGYA